MQGEFINVYESDFETLKSEKLEKLDLEKLAENEKGLESLKARIENQSGSVFYKKESVEILNLIDDQVKVVKDRVEVVKKEEEKKRLATEKARKEEEQRKAQVASNSKPSTSSGNTGSSSKPASSPDKKRRGNQALREESNTISFKRKGGVDRCRLGIE